MYYITLTIGLLLMVLSLKDSSAFAIVVIFAISAPITYFLVQGWCRYQQTQAYIKQVAANDDQKG
jgi:uncharacterized membrane protein